METRKHIASEKLQSGTHNCAQAIVSTYSDIIGHGEETAKTWPILSAEFLEEQLTNLE